MTNDKWTGNNVNVLCHCSLWICRVSFRKAGILFLLLFATRLHAQESEPVVRVKDLLAPLCVFSTKGVVSSSELLCPRPTRTFSVADIRNFPSTLQPWTLLSHAEVSVTVERYDAPGLFGDEGWLYGSRGDSWSQNRVTWNGFDMTSSDGRRPLLMPDLNATDGMTFESATHRTGVAPGAVLALEPRKGSATGVHGSGAVFFQSGALQNTGVSSHVREFGITDSDERYRYFTHGNIQLGGPLSTNWNYFGSASRAQAEKWVRNHDIAAPANLTSETVNFSGTFPNGHRVGLSWIGQQASQLRDGITPQVDAESTRRTSRSFHSVQGSWAGVISARSVFDTGAAFTIGQTDSRFQPGVDKPSRQELFPGFVDIPLVPSAEAGKSIVALLNHAWTGAAPLAESSADRRLQARTQFQATLDGPAASHHGLAFGTNLEWLKTHDRSRAYQDIHLRFFRGSPNSVQLVNPADFSNTETLIEGYVSDAVSIGALGVSFAVQAQWAYARNQIPDSEGSALRWAGVGAHAGIRYQIGSRYPTAFGASLSHRPRAALMRAIKAVHPNGPAIATHFWNDSNQDGAFQPVELGVLTKVEGNAFSSLDPRLKQPYSREVHLEVAQRLPAALTLKLLGFRHVQHQVLALTNTGVSSSAYDPVLVFDPGNDGATQTGDEAWLIAYNQHPQTLGQDVYLVTNTPEGAFSEGYEMHLSQASSRFRWELAFSQYRAVARAAPGNGPRENDWSGLAVINDPNQSINAYGSTFFDRGSGARFLGTWQPGLGLRLSWLFSYLDGLPYGRILPVSGLNQGLIGILATRRGPGDGSPNNSKRGAYNLASDLRLLREFRLSHGRLDATIDVFNVFNMAHQVREADVTSPVHLWRIPLSFQTPRSLQLGLRFSW